MKMKRLKIQTKIMLWYTLLSAILLAVLVPTVYTTVASSLSQTLQTGLQMAISQVLPSIEAKDGQITLETDELDLKDGIYLCIRSREGETLYENPRAQWLSDLKAAEGTANVTENGKSWAVRVQNYETDGVKVTVLAASSLDYVRESLHDLILLLLLLIPVYLFVSALGSCFLAKRAMSPIHQITQTAQAIGNGDMSNRICGVSAKDEVGELADTFNRMLDTLEVSFQRERQFTSDASHELRTPISVISACAEDALFDNSPDVRDNLDTIKNEAERMKKIIAQLLMLSRGYEGRCHFEPEQINLCDMVNSVSEELKDSSQAAGIAIHNDMDKTLEIVADQSLMTQLFVNLLGNAIKYGKSGGNVWLNACARENEVQMDVTDDGIGIGPEDQPHVFERFYRADKARDRSGSGLGLAIVMWIVEMHGGKISVKSRLGYGTTFEVLLPI
jgi:signal transduction histidine kinase